jgi:hypothetical protein
LVAAKLFGKNYCPSGNYLPCFLKIGEFETPHPRYPPYKRSKILEYFKEENENSDVIYVEIRGKHELSDEKQSKLIKSEWVDQAYGKERNIMKYIFRWRPEKK